MSNIAPPLDCDLATVDISMPLLSDNIYDVRIEKAEVKLTATAGGKLIHLDMVTIDPSIARNGSPLGPGIHVFDNVNVVPTGKATWDMIKQNVGSLIQAAQFLPGEVRLNNGEYTPPVEQWAPRLVGKVIRVKVGYEPAGVSKAGKAFKEKNVVGYYTKKV